MPAAYPREFRQDVVAIARKGQMPIAQVAKDFGMKDGRAVLTVRYAMLFYVLKRLGLLGDAAKQSAHTQHIVTINRKETEAALEKAELQL